MVIRDYKIARIPACKTTLIKSIIKCFGFYIIIIIFCMLVEWSYISFRWYLTQNLITPKNSYRIINQGQWHLPVAGIRKTFTQKSAGLRNFCSVINRHIFRISGPLALSNFQVKIGYFLYLFSENQAFSIGEIKYVSKKGLYFEARKSWYFPNDSVPIVYVVCRILHRDAFL